MKNSPAFQFYPADFLSDINVQAMSFEERGIYITALCYCWLENGLDESLVQKIFGEKWKGVQHCFYKVGKRYKHKRLETEKKKQEFWKERARLGGLKKAENKRKTAVLEEENKQCLEPALSKEEAGVKQCISSLSSSSTSVINKDNNKVRNQTDDFGPFFEQQFEKLWKEWPAEGRFKKKYCRMKFLALCRQGKLEEFKKTVRGYSEYLYHKKVNEGFAQRPMHLSTFLNNWEEEKERYIGFEYKPRL